MMNLSSNNEIVREVVEAMGEALNSFPRPPALAGLSRPQYYREYRAVIDGSTVVVEVDKLGFRRYKRRYPWPKHPPPPANTPAIQVAFNAVLPDNLTVTNVEDCGRYIKIFVKELGHD